jgi:hypothetical protein
MNFERAKVDISGNVGILTLDHADVLNAVSPEMLAGLTLAMNHIEDPKHGLRALILTGQGRGFSPEAPHPCHRAARLVTQVRPSRPCIILSFAACAISRCR